MQSIGVGAFSKTLTRRLDCEFDNETIQASGGPPHSGGAMPMIATSPGSVGGGDMPSSQRMDRFELRYDDDV